MKKWRKFFQSFFTRHIAGAESVTSGLPDAERTNNLDMIRFSVWRYLRTAKQHDKFMLDYAADYTTIIDELRMEGWQVRLQAGADGTLVYVISADKSGTLA